MMEDNALVDKEVYIEACKRLNQVLYDYSLNSSDLNLIKNIQAWIIKYMIISKYKYILFKFSLLMTDPIQVSLPELMNKT